MSPERTVSMRFRVVVAFLQRRLRSLEAAVEGDAVRQKEVPVATISRAPTTRRGRFVDAFGNPNRGQCRRLEQLGRVPRPNRQTPKTRPCRPPPAGASSSTKRTESIRRSSNGSQRKRRYRSRRPAAEPAEELPPSGVMSGLPVNCEMNASSLVPFRPRWRNQSESHHSNVSQLLKDRLTCFTCCMLPLSI